MPYGMAMQVYGVRNKWAWLSPMNFAFNIEGAPSNMIATPLWILIGRVVSIYLIKQHCFHASYGKD